MEILCVHYPITEEMKKSLLVNPVSCILRGEKPSDQGELYLGNILSAFDE